MYKRNERILWMKFVNSVFMKSYYHYFFSKHKAIYLQLARKHGISSYRVYQLAHGSRVKKIFERDVLQELIRLGIIADIKRW